MKPAAEDASLEPQWRAMVKDVAAIFETDPEPSQRPAKLRLVE